MTDLNSLTLVCRATKQVELTYTGSGLAIGKFSVAVNKSFKQKDGNYKEEVSFFDVVMFSKMAETLKQYINKGTQMAIQAEIKQETWEKDGQKRSKVVIVAQHVQLLGGHANQDSGSQGDRQPQKVVHVDDFPEDVPF